MMTAPTFRATPNACWDSILSPGYPMVFAHTDSSAESQKVCARLHYLTWACCGRRTAIRFTRKLARARGRKLMVRLEPDVAPRSSCAETSARSFAAEADPR